MKQFTFCVLAIVVLGHVFHHLVILYAQAFNPMWEILFMIDSFSSRVLELTKKIPKGRVSTYSDIAAALGNPKASRAIGNALNKNPHPVTVPCHRVVRSGGCVGGYAFGTEKKIALLKSEGIEISGGKIADFEKKKFIFGNFGCRNNRRNSSGISGLEA